MSRRRTATRPVHPFAAEPGMTDWRGDPLCGCGQPERRAVHQLPDTDPDVTAAERRRAGEREEPE